MTRRCKMAQIGFLVEAVKRPNAVHQAFCRNFLMQYRLIERQFEMKLRSGTDTLAAEVDPVRLPIRICICFTGKDHAGVADRQAVRNTEAAQDTVHCVIQHSAVPILLEFQRMEICPFRKTLARIAKRRMWRIVRKNPISKNRGTERTFYTASGNIDAAVCSAHKGVDFLQRMLCVERVCGSDAVAADSADIVQAQAAFCREKPVKIRLRPSMNCVYLSSSFRSSSR